MVSTGTHSENAGRQAMNNVSIVPEGLYRWKEFAHIVPLGRESWRKRVAEGTAPPKIELGARCTVYRGADILEWLRDPKNYRVRAKSNA